MISKTLKFNKKGNLIMTRTPFEQASYDEQFRIRNRVSGPILGSSFTPDISFTKSDRDIIISIIGLILFVVILMSV